MSKTYYSEYVTHCLKFYAKHPQPEQFRSITDERNWKACEEAVKTLSHTDKDMLLRIYSEGDTVPDTIYKIAKEQGIDQNKIWKLVHNIEHKIAKKRGLL